MKPITLLCFCALIVLQVTAQKSWEQPSLIHLSVGNSLSLGAQATGLSDDSTLVEQNRQNNPTLTLGYDYLISDRWSIGGMLGYNRVYTERHFDNQVGNSRLLESANIHRIYGGVRGLIHYGKNDKIDWYSGVKLGIVAFRTGKLNNADGGEEELADLNNRNRMSLGLIPIGMRFFVSENLGGQIQLSIGSPTFASIGVNYRL